MTRRLHIDFETRSLLDLSDVGVDVYAACPVTDVWCMAYKWSGEGPAMIWTLSQPAPREVLDHAARGGTMIAHNIYFDATIWNELMHKRHGWPLLSVKQLDCTMSRAAAMALPLDLKTLGKALQLTKLKDDEGRRVMLQMMRPRGVNDDLSFKWWNDPDKLARLTSYCLDDVEAEAAVDAVLPPLDASERATWELDFEINKRGCGTDQTLVRNLISVCEHETKKLNTEMQRVTGGKVYGSTDVKGLAAFLQSQHVATNSVAKDVVVELLKSDKLTHAARRALEIRQSAGRASLAKLPRMIESASADGRIRGMFKYHGAATGRWAGGGVQPQNLPRAVFHKDDDESDRIAAALVDTLTSPMPTALHADMMRAYFDGEPMDAATKMLRSCFAAEPGKVLVGADFSNIEGRVLAWLAGEEWLLQAFRDYDAGKGDDIYKLAYARAFGISPKEVTPFQRQIGKVMVLALGYGGGYGAFASMAKNYGVIVLQEGETSTDPKALAFDKVHEIKNGWRAAHPHIKNFWYALERAAMEAVRTHKLTSAGPIKYQTSRLHSGHDVLYCRLPSGRCLSYFSPKIIRKLKFGKMQDTLIYKGMKQVGPAGDKGQRIWADVDLYGGLLAENVTQAVARDVLAETMHRVGTFGNRPMPIALHVHDELVCEVDEDDTDALDRLERCARVVPEWATGLPLAVKGWTGRHYSK